MVTPTQNTTCRIKCPINEICQLQSGKLGEFECICPQELSFFKINSVCREYIGNMSPCHVTRNNDCNLVNNEECLPVDEYTNQGTCQCMTGYQRDQSTFECKSQEYIDKMSIFYDELKRTEYNEARPQKVFHSVFRKFTIFDNKIDIFFKISFLNAGDPRLQKTQKTIISTLK